VLDQMMRIYIFIQEPAKVYFWFHCKSYHHSSRIFNGFNLH